MDKSDYREKNNAKLVAFEIDLDVYEKLKEHSKTTGISQKHIFMQALIKYLNIKK